MESGQPTASRDRPKLAVGYLTLRFTADVFPRFSSISYSICCPSLSVLSPACSTAEIWTNTSLPPACGWINPSPLVGLNHFTVPRAISISQVTIWGDVILIGDLVAKAATELCTAVFRYLTG